MGDPPGALGVALTSTRLGHIGDFRMALGRCAVARCCDASSPGWVVGGPALDGARSAAQVDGRNAVTHFVAKRSVVQVRPAQPKPAARRHPDVVGSEPPAPTKSGGDHVVGRDFARMEAPAAASAACVNTLALTVSFGPPGLCAGSLSREPESSIHLVASYASTFGPVDCNRSRSLRTCLTALVSCAL